ncbi:MAG: hypothetical protein K2N64_03430, partial [Anaeroplasmataceae bacterium]|nr:hypothetical protein [Anaeroplasmataceae bacterium]
MDLKEARELYLKYKASLGCMCRDLDEKKREEFYELHITDGTLRTWKYEHLLKNIERMRNTKTFALLDLLFRDSLFYLETYSDFKKIIHIALELKESNKCLIKDSYLLRLIFNTKTSSPNSKLFDDIDLYAYACEHKDFEFLHSLNQLLSIIFRKNQNQFGSYLSLYKAVIKKYNIPLDENLKVLL